MKNTYDFTVTLEDDEMCIEGKCPQCMDNDELLGFVDILVTMYFEAYKVVKERKLYGKVKSKKKQR